MEKIVGIFLNPKDNVVTVTGDVRSGDTVIYRISNVKKEITALTDIPEGHKISLEDIRLGETVVKYGYYIGTALADIKKGQLVDHHNITGRHMQNEFEQEGE